MKKGKKGLGAWLLALLMMLTMCMPAMVSAAEGQKPTNQDRGTLTVSNLEAGLTVNAYQIVKANYNDSGFTGYSPVDGVTLAKTESPTSTEITNIAKAINGGTLALTAIPLSYSEKTKNYTASAAPGSYVVLVTASGSTVYNPMLVSIYYSVSGSDNQMSSGTVDSESMWTLVTADAFAKSSDPTVEKTIVDPGSKNNKGDAAAVGDILKFQIKTVLPSYSEEYTNVSFTITDELSEGMEYVTENAGKAVVKNGNNVLAEAEAKVVYDGRKMTITFDPTYLRAHGLDEIIVTYQAKLTSAAGNNFVANFNNVKISYSNDPNSNTVKNKEDKTYHYTFAIDGTVDGKNQTNELFKGTDGSIISQEGTSITNPLAGAEFTLKNNTTGKTYTAESDPNGRLHFSGLDTGKYTLTETKAPANYTLDKKAYEVEITAQFAADGKLTSYAIKIDGKATSSYSADYEGDKMEITKESAQATLIKNTKISELPSTGGMGTWIFTIAGVLVMTLAAGVLIFGKKKRA